MTQRSLDRDLRAQAAKLWATLEAFLREVTPVAEACGVTLALHPDDPPLASLHGRPQIVYNVEEIAKVRPWLDCAGLALAGYALAWFGLLVMT